MQVFKTALRIFTKHPIYLSIYVFWLTIMAVFIGMSNAEAPQADFEPELAKVAIIDRDESVLSEGLVSFLAENSILVEVEDSRLALQDATAQNLANYLVIIPEGFGEDFMQAATEGTEAPLLETMVSHTSIAANLMDGLVDGYLNTATLFVSTGTATSQEKAVELTAADMLTSANVSAIELGEVSPVSQQWILYMMFSGYTIMLSIIVCVGVVMAAFNRTEVRRRNLVSPVDSLSRNLQIAASSVVIMVACWLWVSILGLVVFGESLASVDPQTIALVVLSLLAFCTVPLSIAFLLGQLTASEVAMNAVSNITGLAFSFLGGIWVPISLMSENVQILAHFVPTFYYGEAILQTVQLTSFSLDTVAPIFGNMGVMVLFAAAIFAIALAAGRLRIQNSGAGGNATAERARS